MFETRREFVFLNGSGFRRGPSKVYKGKQEIKSSLYFMVDKFCITIHYKRRVQDRSFGVGFRFMKRLYQIVI